MFVNYKRGCYIEEVFGTGKENENDGISGAKGVCTCDEIGKCTCATKVRAVDHFKNQIKLSTIPTLSTILLNENVKFKLMPLYPLYVSFSIC